MRVSTLLLTVASATSSILVGCGGGERGANAESVGEIASAVQGGRLDPSLSDGFAVGVVNRAGGVCTATLIAPNLVLTARHCVVPPAASPTVTCRDKFAASVAPESLEVTTSPNLFRASTYYRAAQVMTPADDSFCGNDIALILLADNIPASEATPVTPAVGFSMTDKSMVSGKVVAIGFGVTNPSAEDSGQRRIRKDIAITCVPGDTDYACDSVPAVEIDDAREFVTEGWVCAGDSGSGAFDQRTFESGKPVVLGTLSRGPETTDTCLAAVYTRTDAHAGLIASAGVKAAELGSYAAAGWTHPVAIHPSAGAAQGCTNEPCEEPTTAPPTAAPPSSSSGCSVVSSHPRSGAFASAFALATALAFARRRRRCM